MRFARYLALLLVLTVPIAGFGGAAASAATVIAVTEVTTSFIPRDVPPAGPSIGDSFTFTADLLAEEEQVGTSSGRSVTIGQGPNGDFTGFIVEELVLPDGRIKAFGDYNQTALQQGQSATIQAVGISGLYAGMTGTLTNTPIEQGRADITIRLD